MGKLQWVMSGVTIFLLLTIAVYFGNDFNTYLRETQGRKEDIEVELKTIYDTEGVRVLDKISSSKEYVRYEVLVEDEIKQVIYFKDTLEIKVIE